MVKINKLKELVNNKRVLLIKMIQSLYQSKGQSESIHAIADQHQWALYEIAMAYAKWHAAKAILGYAQKQQDVAVDVDAATLAITSAQLVVGEMGAELDQLAAAPAMAAYRQADWGASEAFSGITAEAMAHLGRAYEQRGGHLGEDFLSEDNTMIRQSLRRFAEDVVAPQATKIHRADLTVPDDIIDGLRQLGCFGLSIPQRYGGLMADDQPDCLQMLVVTEELSRASLGAAGSLITRPEIIARTLLAGGTEAQKAKWLPALATGEVLCAVSFTEPDTGSDIAAVSLRARQVEGGWRLSGTKIWATFAGKAGLVLVLARTDADIQPAHKGLSVFLIEKPSTPNHDFEVKQQGGGALTGRATPTIGYRGMHSFEMFYDDFFVPDAQLVGEAGGIGKGFYFTMDGFTGGRIQTAARACGLMRAALEAGLSYADSRQVFGVPLKSHQLIACRLGRMAAHLLACRQFTYATGALVNAGGGQMETSLVKMYACRTAEWVTREAMQIHGGIGYAEETPVSRYWLDARVLSIFEGAEEVLALRVVGRRLLEMAEQGLLERVVSTA